jgi:hypothetical protein
MKFFKNDFDRGIWGIAMIRVLVYVLGIWLIPQFVVHQSGLESPTFADTWAATVWGTALTLFLGWCIYRLVKSYRNYVSSGGKRDDYNFYSEESDSGGDGGG